MASISLTTTSSSSKTSSGMSALFDDIVKLFNSIQSIKRKYPTIATYLRHLEKIRTDQYECIKEVDCMKRFLLKNRSLTSEEHILDEWYYHGTKTSIPIFFRNVISYGSDIVIETFWTLLLKLRTDLFPDGLPDPSELVPVASSGEPRSSAEEVMSQLESNPVFAELLPEIKSIVASHESGDIDAATQTKSIGKLINRVKNGLTTGQYNVSDMMSIVNAIGSIKDSSIDKSALDMVHAASSVITSVQKGERPDIVPLMGIMKDAIGSMQESQSLNSPMLDAASQAIEAIQRGEAPSLLPLMDMFKDDCCLD